MSYLLMLGLLAAPGPPDTLRYQVGLYQDWGSREAAGESRLATITRGARLGLWHRFPNAVYGSVADICWRSGRAELARGSIDLDSIRARKLSLGMTAGDRAFTLPIPSGDEALSCRGGAARLASGRADIQALGGRAVEPSAGGCPVSRQNRYLAGILGNVKSARLTLQPFLTQRGDDTTLSGTPTPNRTVLGTSGDFRVSDRVHLDGRLALSAGEPGSLRPKHAVRVGGAFFGPQLTVRTEAKDVAPGFVSPGARSERDGRRHGWASARYQARTFALTGSGNTYSSRFGRMAGSGILGEVAPRTSQLPTLTLKGEYRRCDSLRAYRFLGGGAGLRWTPEYWRLGLEGERRRYFNTGRRGHIAEVRLGYAPSQRLDLDLGAGFRALPDTTADFFRCAVSACPRSWLRLTGNWGVNTSSTHAGRASVVCPAGLGLFISLIPGVGVSGRVSHARGNQPECDSLSYRADLDLKRPLLPWLSLSGGIGVGRIARPSPAGTFRVSLDGGIDFGKELKATLGFARKLEAGVAADQLGFSLYREGGVKKLALATVTGRVFLDRVRDRTFGPGDVPLRGLHVALNGTRAAVTDSRGRFAFPLLERGTYEVRLDPAGLPATQGCHSTVQRVTVSGLAVRTVSFAVCEMGQIAGRVFLDENRNGAYDDDDRSMPNIIVFLQDDVERLTVSNAKGAYLLANVEPGTYRMGIRNLPSGFIITTDGEPLVEVDGDGKVTRDFGIAPTPRPVRILNHEKGNHNRNRNHNRGQ